MLGGRSLQHRLVFEGSGAVERKGQQTLIHQSACLHFDGGLEVAGSADHGHHQRIVAARLLVFFGVGRNQGLVFGALARAAPALNPIQLGLPVALLLGLLLLTVLSIQMGPPVQQLFDQAFDAARQLTG